jgi:hypothetical protein
MHILIPNKFPSSHLFSSDDVIDIFLNRHPLFFLDSDSPFNCLNDSIQILLSYVMKFLRKKIITGKNKFYNEKNSHMFKHIFAYLCIFQCILS